MLIVAFSEPKFVSSMLIATLPLVSCLPHLLINCPVRLRHSLQGFLQRFALRVEPFLFFEPLLLLEQGGFFLCQCKDGASVLMVPSLCQ